TREKRRSSSRSERPRRTGFTRRLSSSARSSRSTTRRTSVASATSSASPKRAPSPKRNAGGYWRLLRKPSDTAGNSPQGRGQLGSQRAPVHPRGRRALSQVRVGG